MASHEDSWESLGWEAAWQPPEEADREQVRRELEVERRTKELDEREGRPGGRRTIRLRRGERAGAEDADRAYSEEILARREAELRVSLETLATRERGVSEREAALRARELD